nr:VWA domain-containing protein [Deltaproteobacteria bacterium]
MKTVCVLLISILAACGPGVRDQGPGGDDDADNPPVDPPPGEPRACNKMDIVFVVDDSGSMSEEQSNLASNFPMFAELLSTYVTPEGEPIDYRVAVTTTGRDMD